MIEAKKQMASISRLAWLLPWLTTLIIGAALALLAMMLYYQTGSHSEANVPLSWNGSDLLLTRGQGVASPDDPGALTIQPADASGVILWTPPRWINAGLYSTLVWKISGLEADHPVLPIWQTPDGQISKAAQMTTATAGQASLSTEQDWQGTVSAQGIFIPGPLPSPIIVHRLELQPATLTTGQWLEQLWQEWTTYEDWSPRSINFTAGATPRPLGSLVLFAAVGIGLSGLLYGGWMLSADQRLRLAPFVAFFLLGWLLLDLHWHWELSQRLEQTVERFAGKDAIGRRLADLDGDLYRFSLEVRQHLPAHPVRLFIISNDPTGFMAGRARYHLLPHNGSGLLRPPLTAREGDYLLVLPTNGVLFNSERRLLEWENAALAAEMLYSAPQGALFRVLGG